MIYAVITTAPRRPNKATTLAAANQQRQRTNGGSEGVGFHDNDSLNRFGSGCSSIGYLDEEGYWLFLSDSCPYERIEAKGSFAEVKGSFVEAQVVGEEIFDENHYIPLASCLEALPPSSYDHVDIIKNLNSDGSLYQSTSATAQAFMATGNADCLTYLQSVVHRCPQGGSFCWFLNYQEIRQHVENNPECFSSVMLDVFKATELMFPEEIELDEARSFSRNSLEKVLSIGQYPSLTNMIEHEINFHGLHKWVIFKIKCGLKKRTIISGWEKVDEDNGLSDLGFGRERTTYCYFAIASCDSFGASMRMMVSKLAILITVADDLYDAKGSIHELRALTDAIRRWDGIGLTDHNKTIFKALDNYMTLVAANHQQQHGIDISYYHRAIVSA
ncbi:hypothetical protein ACFE04_000044 [Oxalis oulophora]